LANLKNKKGNGSKKAQKQKNPLNQIAGNLNKLKNANPAKAIKDKIKQFSVILAKLYVQKIDHLIKFVDKLPNFLRQKFPNFRERLLTNVAIDLKSAKLRCEGKFGKGNCVKFGAFGYVFKCKKGKRPVWVQGDRFKCQDGKLKFDAKKDGLLSTDDKVPDFANVYDISFFQILDQ